MYVLVSLGEPDANNACRTQPIFLPICLTNKPLLRMVSRRKPSGTCSSRLTQLVLTPSFLYPVVLRQPAHTSGSSGPAEEEHKSPNPPPATTTWSVYTAEEAK